MFDIREILDFSAKENMVKVQVKVNKWDAIGVKNALDDAVKNAFFSSRPQLKEQFGLIEGRLVVSSCAVCLSILCHLWDYMHPFPESKPLIIFSFIGYFVLLGILKLHGMFHEKGIIAVAVEKKSDGSQRTWEISSRIWKYDDKYSLVFSVKDSKTLREVSSEQSCGNFIYNNGVIADELVAHEVNALFSSLSSQMAALEGEGTNNDESKSEHNNTFSILSSEVESVEEEGNDNIGYLSNEEVQSDDEMIESKSEPYNVSLFSSETDGEEGNDDESKSENNTFSILSSEADSLEEEGNDDGNIDYFSNEEVQSDDEMILLLKSKSEHNLCALRGNNTI